MGCDAGLHDGCDEYTPGLLSCQQAGLVRLLHRFLTAAGIVERQVGKLRVKRNAERALGDPGQQDHPPAIVDATSVSW